MPLKPPQQHRSRRTLERIVSATLDILAEGGAEALTVQAIVSRARSSVGSFYARFSGKEDLLDYLEERLWRDAATRWDRSIDARDWDGLDLAGVVDGCLELLAESRRSRAEHLRALGGIPGARHGAYEAFRSHVLTGTETLLLDRSHQITHPDPATAVRLGVRAASAVLDLAAVPADRADIDDARIVQEARLLLLAYLAGEPTTPEAAPGQVDFFDIWG